MKKKYISRSLFVIVAVVMLMSELVLLFNYEFDYMSANSVAIMSSSNVVLGVIMLLPTLLWERLDRKVSLYLVVFFTSSIIGSLIELMTQQGNVIAAVCCSITVVVNIMIMVLLVMRGCFGEDFDEE
ncbi:MAG: hypothetical protein IIU72_02505 [Muribaculaceae bacterium]|nr:hypothetical protein [Muribaculaceae bacterium]